MRRTAVAAAGLAAGLAAVLALAGCTSSGRGGAQSTPPASPLPSTPAVASSTPPPSSTPTPTPTPSSSARTSLPPHLSKPPLSTVPATPTTTPPPAARSTCTHVTVRVIPGGAEQGAEFAALQFTNAGTARCVLVGYATVTLTRAGKQLGKPSEPAAYKASRRTLAPGATAESKLFDYTQNCQAPLSDAVRVVVPGTSITTQRPQFVMRGCILRVDPLGAPE